MGKKRRRPSEKDAHRGEPSKQQQSSRSTCDSSPAAASLEGWISALAKESAQTTKGVPVSRSERIEKRAAKKLRAQQRKRSENPDTDTGHIHIRRQVVHPPGAEEESENENAGMKPRRHNNNNNNNNTSKKLTQTLAATVQASVSALAEAAMTSKESRRPYSGTFKPSYSKLKWNAEDIQPRRRDYGGIGLARPSLFLSLSDASFVPKLEEEFAEHIPGFFGKQRTKAMKKQQSRNMLWRQMADQKKIMSKGNPKVQSKKRMTPDERVEAMIKTGMI